MQSGFLWLASGMWASQQSGEQKSSGSRLRLQVDTEQRYHSAPKGIGFLHTLQRLQADSAPVIIQGSPGEHSRGSSRGQAAAYVPRTARRKRPLRAPPDAPQHRLSESFDLRVRILP